MREDLLARTALACLVEPGNRDMWQLVADHGPAGALDRVRDGEIPPDLAATIAPRLRLGDPLDLGGAALDRTTRMGGRVITPTSAEWPAHVDDLRRISHESPGRHARDVYPPLCLWLRGGPPLSSVARRSVAVVGARASTPYGDHVATELAYGLAERGWTVVSGGAFGIDAQAHRGALAAGGVTVAVLASGVDRAYPQAHANLFDRIADDGLLLSEWPPGAAPHRFRFLQHRHKCRHNPRPGSPRSSSVCLLDVDRACPCLTATPSTQRRPSRVPGNATVQRSRVVQLLEPVCRTVSPPHVRGGMAWYARQ